MPRSSVAFALGALFCQQLPQLPDPLLLGFGVVLLALVRATGAASLFAVFLLGVAWTGLHGRTYLARQLPLVLEGTDITVQVEVEGIPIRTPRGAAFQARVLPGAGGSPLAPGCRLRLRSYQPQPQVAAGEQWRLTLRLRRPRGTRNPGDRDREHQAMRDGLCAVGYLRRWPAASRLRPAGRGSWHGFRAGLARQFRTAVGHLPGGALTLALALGERSDLSDAQRQLLRDTGTAHLVAISGLHVGLVAGAAALLGGTVARRSARLCQRRAARDMALVTGLAAAVLYAALAGFTLPTQRALAMLTVLCVMALCRRRGAPLAGLAVALLAVLLRDPFAVLGVDLWLSFTAALALMLCLGAMPGGRRADDRTAGSRLWRVLLAIMGVQLVAGLSLMPVTLHAFGQQAWLGPLYNALAVPVTGAVAIPTALLGVALAALHLPGAELLLQVSAHVLGLLLDLLRALWSLEPHWRPAATASLWAALFAALGVALALRGQYPSLLPLAAVLCVPMLAPAVSRPGPGMLWLDVMDVGQGLAAVVRTERHTLVYDTGPPWSGGAVIATALRNHGEGAVDVLLLSHGDSDHAGGAARVLASVPVRRVIGNALPEATQGVSCHAAGSWEWDGYRFQILHPPRPRAGNDGSCVLHVSGPGGAALLSGDVEASAEREIVRRVGGGLRAQVLVAPHHGSRSSSTPALLDAVAAQVVVIPSGHGNRFGFPHDTVLERYAARDMSVFNTACDGRVRVVMSVHAPTRVNRWSPRARRFWHTANGAGQCARPLL